MSDCEACANAKTNPDSGVYHACLGCDIRALANSPAFHDSMRDERLSKTYQHALRFVFGGGWVDGHAKVKAEAERLKFVRGMGR